ncbi:DUF6069 family protein [Actinorugispora endophytica]|uniref:Uncharacterized protein n=1 Tax=Actinorugispora endophytica TaxID=1605990 RepID=A0A4R6UVH9_9ACTN|nr:DUF6069 family protein [Actinorugispora endophytica]TDQ49959.1 hypothetical protein EV190_1143 [Actinorugispora endophytica]
MAQYGPDVGGKRRTDPTKLWAGGLATAVVAALVVLVGTLIIRGLLGIPVLAPEETGRFGGTGTAAHTALAAFGALSATGLLHLLLLSAPRPLTFFGWIVGLATVVAAITPFTRGASPADAIGTSLVNLAVGSVVLSLLGNVGASSRPGRRRLQRRPTRSDGSLPGTGYDARRPAALPPDTYLGRTRLYRD